MMLPMKKGDKTMGKLAAKISAVMKDCNYVEKNGTNTFHGYQYATSADVLAKVNTALVKHGIASIAKPELIDIVNVTTTKGNIEKLATIQMTIKLIDVESGETYELVGIGSGQDAGDKAIMKAETAAIKYAYMLSFAISTGDDPEADKNTDEYMAGKQAAKAAKPAVQPKQESAKPAVPHATCSECGAAISDRVKEYSTQKFGRALCMRCQHRAQESA